MSIRDETQRAINICFHGIGEPARPREPGEDEYWIGVDSFEAILDEIVTWPNVAISFDDGNASDHDIGLPRLEQRGLTGSFFVLAARLDAPGSLSTEQLRDLVAAGMTVGSHGMHHVPWTGLDDQTRTTELVEAREMIAAAVGVDVDEAACPLGRYDRSALRALRSLGYSRVHTSDRTTARRDAWMQPRYSVTHTDTPATLRRSILERQSVVHRLKPSMVGLVKRLR